MITADWEREVRYNQAIRRDAWTPAAEARKWRRRFFCLLAVNIALVAFLALLVRS